MKKMIATALASFSFILCFGQNASVTWGDEFKMRKGSTDLEVIYTDHTGVYVKESHFALKAYFVIGATTRESATLIKLDKNLTQQYDNDFNKELKGKEFEKFFFIKNKLYLLASDYNKKEKTLTLYAAEIDKNNGELKGDWTELTAWTKDDKKEEVNFKPSYNADSTKMILVSTIEGREKNNYEIRLFDENMKPLGKAASITNEFEPKLYSLEDVVPAYNGNIVLVGREYEYQEGKKKKAKYLDFKNYNVRIYSNTGSLLKEVNTTVNGKWLISTKLAQLPTNELVLAAFYSNEKRGREVNGMLIQRINPSTGEVVSTSSKEINTSMITTLDDDNNSDGDEETKKERKERERLEKIQNEEDGFSRYMRFRNFIYTADGGLVILAEKYNQYVYTTQTYEPGFGNSPGTWRTTTYQVYECGDVMMSKMDAGGNIGWLYVVPKQQREVIQTDRSYGGSFFSYSNYFITGFNWPFYAGIGVLPGKETVHVIFNDHKNNKDVLQLGQKVKRISYYGRTDCFAIALNTSTGKYTRSSLFSNNDVPTAMPRLSSVLNNELYLIGKEDRIFGKSKMALARLSIK